MSSIKAKARFAGILYALMNIPAVFNLIYIPAAFIVPGDATATAHRITDGALTYRIGILGGLVSSILFLLVVWVFYDLLKDVDKKHAMVMVSFVSLAVAVAVVNLINQIAPLVLLSGADFLSVFTKPQLDALALGFLRLNSNGNLLAEAFWGLWLLPLGVLVRKSGFIPKILGTFLIAACFAYLAVSFTAIVSPAHGHVVSLVTLPFMALGEGSFLIWLLVRGAKVQSEEARPSHST